MEKEIVKDVLFLSQVSQPASQDDLYLARELQDTLLANRDSCVGLAANMIGERKRVIIFNLGLVPMVMFNPVLKSFSGPYETEEGCPCLELDQQFAMRTLQLPIVIASGKNRPLL